MLARKLFEHFGVGGIVAARRLLDALGAVTQFFKEHFGKLHRRIEVEFAARERIDALRERFHLRSIPRGKFGKFFLVHAHARLFHFKEHAREGEFKFAVKAHAVFIRRAQGVLEAPHERIGAVGRRKGVFAGKIFGGRRLSARVEEIGQEPDVLDGAAYGRGGKAVQKRLIVGDDRPLVSRKEGSKELCDVLGEVSGVEERLFAGEDVFRAADADVRGALSVFRKGKAVRLIEGGLEGGKVGERHRFGVRFFVLFKERGVDEGAEFQLVERGARLGGEGEADGELFDGNGEGNVRVDGRERVRKLRALPSRNKAVFHARRKFVKVLIDAFRRAVLLQQREGGLGPDAGNARDIVGRVAHERLLFDDLRRGESHLFEEVFVREAVGLGDAALGEAHRNVFVHELIGIPVTRIDDGGNALIGAREGADEIVRLITFKFHIADAHGAEHLFERGELHDECLGRRGARALVFLEHLVAEGGGVQVEGDPEIVGLLFFEDLEDEFDESEDGVGGEAVFGREAVDGVERAVHEAVAVDENESLLFHILIVSRAEKFCKKKAEIA